MPNPNPAVNPNQAQLPIQPVDRPILCSPYREPTAYWDYDSVTGEARKVAGRRPAGYYVRTEQARAGQISMPLLTEENRQDLGLVNRLRADVKRWRENGYEGATPTTKELLRAWWREDRPRRLFDCQLEAVETVIHLAEIRFAGRKPRFNPQTTDADLVNLKDLPADPDLGALTRFGCKMATGSGKTIVMAMLISWALCNRGRNPSDERFPSAVLVCCPNLTVKERLQVLRPDHPDNYYQAFDLVPMTLRPLLGTGKVAVLNWHQLAKEGEHVEGGKSYAVVNKGEESPDAFARRVLGDLYDHAPILVLNDEGHHAYRPAPLADKLTGEEAQTVKADREEATIWIQGLDRINQSAGVRFCVDLSATPFYIAGSGYQEGLPFPWLVSDFGLVDAIESGIVKIPRLPVSDSTGRPEPAYFRLWQHITDQLQPAQRLPGKAKKPKPDVIYEKAEFALNTLAAQWAERFEYVQAASPTQDKAPPVLIVVCDNTDIAEIFYRNISGEESEPIPANAQPDPTNDPDTPDASALSPGRASSGERGVSNPASLNPALLNPTASTPASLNPASSSPETAKSKSKNPKTRTSYGHGKVFPEYFENHPGLRRTLRIDSKLLAEAESEDPRATRQTAAEELRRIVATVGRPGEPGEQIRCVVSVGMLTEGWDANNVTHILGVRAFGSQLLSEQVVGRGLRRLDYTPDPETGLLTEEYVDVYGIPFSVIPFKGRETDKKAPEDRPKNHVRALPERQHFAIRFPVVEGYVFALHRNVIKADIARMDPLEFDPTEPTALFVQPTVGYRTGAGGHGPGEYDLQTRDEYYQRTHIQAIVFEIARQVVNVLTGNATTDEGHIGDHAFHLRSRQQLFPQVLGLVQEYVARKINVRGGDIREIGHLEYTKKIVERLVAAIEPDETEGESPLLPILNRYKPIATTADVDFKTTKPCHPTRRSHLNQAPADTLRWENSAVFRLEQAADQHLIACYARNEELGLRIPYDYDGVSHHYEPDYLVKLSDGRKLILEIKGYEDDQDHAKHTAARRWVAAVNHWGQEGRWDFRVCKDPQQLVNQLRHLLNHPETPTSAPPLSAD